MTIAERLREIRNILSLSQEKLANFLKVNRSFLAQIETGIRKPSEQTLLVLEKETGVSKDWLETGRGLIFSDYRKGLAKIREKINLNETLSKYEIEFILNLIQLSWSTGGSLPANPIFIKNLISIFEYVYKNCKIKNINFLGGDKYFVDFITNPNIPKTVKDSKTYIADKLVVLFRDGEFELSKKDCETISSLLLPWGYYVGLSYVEDKKQRKISSIDMDINIEDVETNIILEKIDIPKLKQEKEFEIQIWATAENLNSKYNYGAYSLKLKEKQIYIHMTIFDLVEFILLLKKIFKTQEKEQENREYRVGNFVISRINAEGSIQYLFRKVCDEGFIIELYFEKEQFKIFSQTLEYFEKYYKFITFAKKTYIDRFGFV
ncbi:MULTISPECIES: helix-turn-helix domain-containing protein [Thermodesulfovibrio]|jgi:transcriptional regulator with XRE-family HTH domain|uniref:helix-turn-helix domain-containing protein n=1 Tax=Thermodesulfovibrio TaxID=28261 RepID=UPI0026103BCB|nr:helix-turn-helix transcriptional regulator [Thermodesulfovibrio sp.]